MYLINLGSTSSIQEKKFHKDSSTYNDTRAFQHEFTYVFHFQVVFSWHRMRRSGQGIRMGNSAYRVQRCRYLSARNREEEVVFASGDYVCLVYIVVKGVPCCICVYNPNVHAAYLPANIIAGMPM